MQLHTIWTLNFYKWNHHPGSLYVPLLVTDLCICTICIVAIQRELCFTSTFEKFGWGVTVLETYRDFNDHHLVMTTETDCFTWPPDHENVHSILQLATALDWFTLLIVTKFNKLWMKWLNWNRKVCLQIQNNELYIFSVCFVAGKRLYIMKNPGGNIIGDVSTCIGVSRNRHTCLLCKFPERQFH